MSHKYIGFGFVLASSALLACQDSLETARPEPSSDPTVGREIFKVFCERMVSEDHPTDVTGEEARAICARMEAPLGVPPPSSPLGALVGDHDRLVEALDHTLPQNTHDDLKRLLVDIVPLYDEIFPRITRETGARLEALAANEEFTLTLGRFSARTGYRRPGLGVSRTVLAYPNLDELFSRTLTVLDVDGVAHEAWRDVLQAAAFEAATLEPDADSPTTVALVRDLAFRTDPTFGRNSPMYAVLRDARGFAVPSVVINGIVPAPFVDGNEDGLADIGARGYFLGSNGSALSLPPPFRVANEQGVLRDDQGRAIQANGDLVWRSFDADPTLLAGLLRESASLLRVTTPTLLDAARGVRYMLGPDAIQTESYGTAALTYNGFDTSQGPLFDIVHGAAQVVPTQAAVDVLQVTETLLRDHEGPVAELLAAALHARERADAYPTVGLPHANIFWDQELDVVRRMAEQPGLIEDVMRSMTSAELADLDAMLWRVMYFKDRVSIPIDTGAPVSPGIFPLPDRTTTSGAPVLPGSFMLPVDRTQPDVAENESLLQQALHLIHDLNRVTLCNKRMVYNGLDIGECQFFQIKNVADAYLKAVTGRYRLEVTHPYLIQIFEQADEDTEESHALRDALVDPVIAGLFGKGMGMYPTPQALARFVFSNRTSFADSIVGELKAADGEPIEDRHCIGRRRRDRSVPCNSVLFALEKPILLGDGRMRSFIQVLAPLLRAFEDHQPPGISFFADIASAAHLAYATRNSTRTQPDPTAPGFSHQYGLRDYEPLIIEVLRDEHLFERLRNSVIALEAVQIPQPNGPDIDGVTALARAAEILADPARSCNGSCDTGAFRDRAGRDHICWNDGRCWDGQEGRPLIRPSPLSLMLDGLYKTDLAWLAAPADVHTHWLEARSRIVDQVLSVKYTSAGWRFTNQRGRAIALTLLPFFLQRIEAHRVNGDAAAREWAAGLATDAEDALASPLGAGLVHLIDRILEDPEARTALARFLGYMVDESSSDAFEALLVTAIDLLQILDDRETLIPAVHALAPLFAPNVEDVLAQGGDVSSDTSLVYQTIDVLRRINDADDARVLRRVLANAVSLLPDRHDPTTPLEEVADVICDVNQVTPEAGNDDPLTAEDWAFLMRRAQEFLADDERGLERLYAIIQNRTLPR